MADLLEMEVCALSDEELMTLVEKLVAGIDRDQVTEEVGVFYVYKIKHGIC